MHDTFDNLNAGGPVTDWNIYSPRWSPVGVADFPSAANKSLELQDKDPYDYARAVRVFPETKSATIHFKVHAGQNNAGRLEIEVTDRFGFRPVRMIFAEDGQIKAMNGAESKTLAPYQPGKWYDVDLKVDVANGTFDISLAGKPVASASVVRRVRQERRADFLSHRRPARWTDSQDHNRRPARSQESESGRGGAARGFSR